MVDVHKRFLEQGVTWRSHIAPRIPTSPTLAPTSHPAFPPSHISPRIPPRFLEQLVVLRDLWRAEMIRVTFIEESASSEELVN